MSERNIPELLIPVSLAQWLDYNRQGYFNDLLEESEVVTTSDTKFICNNGGESVIEWLVLEGVLEQVVPDHYRIVKKVRLVRVYSVLNAAINPKWTTDERSLPLVTQTYPDLFIGFNAPHVYFYLTDGAAPVSVTTADLLRYVEDGLRKDGKL